MSRQWIDSLIERFLHRNTTPALTNISSAGAKETQPLQNILKGPALSAELLKQTVLAGIQQALREGTVLSAEKDSQRKREAPLRAAKIIAAIPKLAKTSCAYLIACLIGRGQTIRRCDGSVNIMTLEPYESLDFPRYDSPSPERLRYAARLVYDHCVQAGLEPQLAHSDGKISDQGHHFFISVRYDVRLPEGATGL